MDSLDAFLTAELHYNPVHAADVDLIVKIHEILQWNLSAKVVLIQRTANAAANFLAKSAVDKMGHRPYPTPLFSSLKLRWVSIQILLCCAALGEYSLPAGPRPSLLELHEYRVDLNDGGKNHLKKMQLRRYVGAGRQSWIFSP
ncbi:hypothetical protein PIB30_072144 [Stylosanthes scabra]|uniref:RNase H type-1 domain-containing protein n=1 Tax=Stylosanthes scabra TaxID=79078 RepID=A0ABU6YMZ7_9FABA|nr:hypothetical protein [Stylosanthes scabra]